MTGSLDAEIIAVGSELLTPQRLDTNSLYITEKLNALGVEVTRKSVVGDDRERLAKTITTALGAARIVILTGGLGPTEDDVTRDATAAALGRSLQLDQSILTWLEERFRSFGRVMAEINKRQAYLIEGAVALPNPRGTAPGQWIEHDGAIVMLLPGPPRELKPMFERECIPRLEAVLPKQAIRVRSYRVTGIGESDLDALIAPVYTKYTNPVTTVLAAPGDVQIHLRARCDTEAQADALLAEVGPQIESLLGARIYSRTLDPLWSVTGALLRESGATIAVAESCTGGLLGERLTTPPGSSDYFVGGFLTYTDEMKVELLGVDLVTLEQYTAVSEQTAKQMAQGARERTGATYGVSITGIAGPDGGTESTPVGTVFIGFSSAGGSDAKHYRFPGDRAYVRTLAVQAALDLVRRRIRS